MIQFRLKKKLEHFICKIIIILIFLPLMLYPSNEDDKILYENTKFVEFMKIAIPITIVTTGLVLVSREEFRIFVTDKWAEFTSPNHTAPDQQISFYIKPFSEQYDQNTQCDKGVHFMFSYLPVIPVAMILDRGYYFLTEGKIKSELSTWSIWSGAVFVTGFGLLEEYMDGHQEYEGFDLIDVAFNSTGTLFAIMKHYCMIDYIDFYWSFNREMYEESANFGTYPWWTFMSGYEFAVNVDLYSLLTDIKKNNNIFNLLIRTPGYIPDLKKLSYSRYN